MSRCDIGIRAIQWLGRVVSHVATRHTTHSHIHTTASLYELTVNSSRVVSPLCSIAAVHQHRVTRQAAQCLSSCVPPLPPLRPLVAVSSLTAVVLRLSVVPPSSVFTPPPLLSVALPVVLLAHPPPFAAGANWLLLVVAGVALCGLVAASRSIVLSFYPLCMFVHCVFHLYMLFLSALAVESGVLWRRLALCAAVVCI